MPESEGLGGFGVALLVIVAIAAVVAVVFGFTATFWFALILVPVVFAALLMLCRGPAGHETD